MIKYRYHMYVIKESGNGEDRGGWKAENTMTKQSN